MYDVSGTLLFKKDTERKDTLMIKYSTIKFKYDVGKRTELHVFYFKGAMYETIIVIS